MGGAGPSSVASGGTEAQACHEELPAGDRCISRIYITSVVGAVPWGGEDCGLEAEHVSAAARRALTPRVASRPCALRSMKHVAAYLLLVLGGNEAPSAADVKGLLSASNIEADDESLGRLITALEGNDLAEVLAEGKEMLSFVGGGGGGAVAASGDAGAAEEAEAEKEESEKEESAGGAGGLFDDDDDDW